MKEHGIGKKKNTVKKLNEVYYLFSLYFVCETVTCSALFISGKAVQLTWYEFSSKLVKLVNIYYLHQLQPPSLVYCLLGEWLW